MTAPPRGGTRRAERRVIRGTLGISFYTISRQYRDGISLSVKDGRGASRRNARGTNGFRRREGGTKFQDLVSRENTNTMANRRRRVLRYGGARTRRYCGRR